ncbi:MAG TPA: hypothetical protein VID75_04550 [Acidimicrobiales bacterium]|jgi:hypothetical protein
MTLNPYAVEMLARSRRHDFERRAERHRLTRRARRNLASAPVSVAPAVPVLRLVSPPPRTGRRIPAGGPLGGDLVQPRRFEQLPDAS